MKRRNKNGKGKIAGASLLAMIVVLISVFVSVAAAAPWEGYLVPQDSTGNYGEDTAVELGVTYDATGLTYGAVAYQVDVHFDPSCVNITAADFSTSPFGAHMFTPYAPGVVRILENSIATMVPISSGTYKMATLTFHGCSTSCTCDIWFDTNVVSDTDGELIANTYTNGTYTAPTPTPTPTPTTPCFIATAAYGTSLHEDIDVLRDFRDKYLMTNPLGGAFVEIYYTASPPVADVIRENEGLRTAVREGLIKPLVYVSRMFVGEDSKH